MTMRRFASLREIIRLDRGSAALSSTKRLPLNFSLADESKFTLKSHSSLSVAPIDEKLAEVAALIRARHTIRLPDALQVAAAVKGEATLF